MLDHNSILLTKYSYKSIRKNKKKSIGREQTTHKVKRLVHEKISTMLITNEM